MKKLFVTMLSIMACGAAYALPVGNPADASLLTDGLVWEGFCGDPCDPCLSWCDAWSFRFGFYGDYVFNRHLQVDEGDDDDDGRNIEHTRIFTNAGYLALNFWDRFDVFGTLGVSNFCIDTNARTFGVIGTGARFEIESSSTFSWSVGARATLWECGCTTLGIEGQYFQFRPDIKRVTRASTLSVYPDHNIDSRYHEWQVGLGLAHRINIFVPYVAVKWSRARLNFNDATVLFPTTVIADFINGLENRKSWGYAVGVSLIDCEKASLCVEGRWADEKAVYVNGQIRF